MPAQFNNPTPCNMQIPSTVSAAWVRPGIARIRIEKEAHTFITAEEIIDNTCKYFGLNREELFRKSSKAAVVYPRQLMVYLMCTNTDLTLTEIAIATGLKDHSTVSYSRDKIAGLIELRHETKLRADLLGILNVNKT